MCTEIVVKWRDREIKVPVESDDTVGTLKHRLQVETCVDTKKQKLIGLKTKDGKLAQDDVLVSNLTLKAGAKVMLMGTPDVEIEQGHKQAAAAPEIQDDFDIDPSEPFLELKDRPEVQEKLQRRLNSVELKVLSPPRANKKCLVLDIDYTLFDLGSSAERPEELARPYLHEFLTACYPFYDIIIWSATSMKWVEVKMRELGVLTHDSYKIVTLMDHSAMVTVHTEKYGVFDCKPLAFLWGKFPEYYNNTNTVMLDDLRRNYILNKQNGLVIRPYRKAHLNRLKDKELLYLTHYLTSIASLPSLEHLNHQEWERHVRDQ